MLRLRELREQKNLSQQRLAIDLSISQAAISKYEKKLAEPDIGMLKKMADYFCVSIDYLVGRTNINTYYADNPPSIQEYQTLYIYRRLSNQQKEKAIAYMQGMLDG